MNIFVDSRLTKGMQRELAETVSYPFHVGFTLTARNGMEFYFKGSFKRPLYKVYDSTQHLCGYVYSLTKGFKVTVLGGKTILQIIDESLEPWPNEAIARLAAEVLAEWKALE